jgi:fumarate hydratase class II
MVSAFPRSFIKVIAVSDPFAKSQKTRLESDALGSVEVSGDRYWGAQTERALRHFKIGREPVPKSLIRAFGLLKKTAAIVNVKLGLLPLSLGDAIVKAAEEVASGELDGEFPLLIWQSGSGTQTNMNVNEVIANRAIQILGGEMGTKSPVHPNDHVNLGQSTNDGFPTAMHMATVCEIQRRLIPALDQMHHALLAKALEWHDIVKIGRTHLQDATPLMLGQEFSGYAAQIGLAKERVRDALKRLYPLAQGGTAVGTGMNAKKDFACMFAQEIAALTGYPFVTAENKFEAQATHDAMAEISGVLNTIAVGFTKIANDIRLLSSGPLCGIGELVMPENEPGSSIMPGKVNPTQAEAMCMVAAQVMGNHMTVTVACAGGHFELNAYKPLIIYNVLSSIELLADVAESFTKNCLEGLKPDLKRIKAFVDRSLMLATALNPHIGYDKVAKMVIKAREEGTTVKEAGLALGFLTAEEYDSIVKPEKMVQPLD